MNNSYFYENFAVYNAIFRIATESVFYLDNNYFAYNYAYKGSIGLI
jgi:hypothetical protein